MLYRTEIGSDKVRKRKIDGESEKEKDRRREREINILACRHTVSVGACTPAEPSRTLLYRSDRFKKKEKDSARVRKRDRWRE